MFNWDWKLSEKELRRALELNPNLAQAHLYYGQYLRTQGRLDGSVAEHRAALELDPTSQFYNQGLCAILLSAECLMNRSSSAAGWSSFTRKYPWFTVRLATITRGKRITRRPCMSFSET